MKTAQQIADRYRFLFRGKDIDTETWKYGHLVMPVEKKPRIIIDGTEDRCIVYPDSVGQCTGTHDKNLTYIWEGDLVYVDQYPEEMHVVEWDKISASYLVRSLTTGNVIFIRDLDNEFYKYPLLDGDVAYLSKCNNIEVIGKYYEYKNDPEGFKPWRKRTE